MKTKILRMNVVAIPGIFFLIAMVLILTSWPVSAQQNQGNQPGFYEIQRAMRDYYKNLESTKGTGYKPYKRWEWFWEQRVGRDGLFPAGNARVEAWSQYLAAHPDDVVLDSAANWKPMGPSTTSSGYAGLGRINCIAFHPTIKNTFWIGTPSGGVWKTTDFGQSWTTSFDASPVLGVSDMVISGNNPQLMYIATGDGDGGSFASYQSLSGGDNNSIGVLKSYNGGGTWTTTGLSWSASEQALIRRIIMHPGNDDILFVSSTKGIYKTTDAGANWTLMQEGIFTDIAFNTSNPSVMYAASKGDDNPGQVWRSEDDGVNWNVVTNFTVAKRVILAVTPQQSDLVEALCTNESGGLDGIYRSTDGGVNFNPFFTVTSNCSNNMLNSYPDPQNHDNSCGGQGSYDLCYLINPSNSAERWLGGVNTWKSSNSGQTWVLVNYWDPDLTQYKTVHADKHWFAFHPLQPGTFLEANDGGIYYTNDGGSNWTDISQGMQIGQIYRIANAYTDTNIVSGGFQDNGSQVDSAGTWRAPSVIGGDGMMCRIDYGNASIKYASYADGVIYRTTEPDWSNTVTISKNIPGTPKGEWVTPYIIHPGDPATLYAGYRDIYKTTNRGDSWQKASSFGAADPADDTLVRHIAISRSNPQIQYCATKYSLFKTTDGWATHVEIDNGLPVDSCVITSVAVHPTRPDTMYVTFSGYKSGKKVYRSYNGGSNWSNISGNLPNIPVNCLIYQDSADEALYLGTDLGVWFTNANLTNWIRYSQSLPNVVVTDLDIHYMNGKIRAATYGRGLWESPLYIEPGKRQINATDLPVVGGDVRGDGVYLPGETAVLEAMPQEDWQFEGWYESGIKVSDTSVYSFTVENNRNLVGLFITASGVGSLAKEGIRMMPNPSRGKVEILLDNDLNNRLLKVYITDMQGRAVCSEENFDGKERLMFDLSSKNSGQYVVTFIFSNGRQISNILVIAK